MAGQIHDNGLPVNRLVIDLTDDELAAVLRCGWANLAVLPGAPLVSVKYRIAAAAKASVGDPIDLCDEEPDEGGEM